MNFYTQKDYDYTFKINELTEKDFFLKFKFEQLKFQKENLDKEILELKIMLELRDSEDLENNSILTNIQIQKVDALKDSYDLDVAEFERIKADFIDFSKYISMIISTRPFIYEHATDKNLDT